MSLFRFSGAVIFSLLATVGCTIEVAPKDKADGGAGGTGGTGEAGATKAGGIVCCRTEPEAGPEGCLCEPVAMDIIMVNETGTSCSASTTVNGQAVDFSGYVVLTCP